VPKQSTERNRPERSVALAVAAESGNSPSDTSKPSGEPNIEPNSLRLFAVDPLSVEGIERMFSYEVLSFV
jgi:hypothetical protein